MTLDPRAPRYLTPVASSAPAQPPTRPPFRWAARCALAASLILMAAAAWEMVGTDMAAERAQHDLANQFETTATPTPEPTVTEPTVTAPAAPVTTRPAPTFAPDDGTISPAIIPSTPLPLPTVTTTTVPTDPTGPDLFTLGSEGTLAGRLTIPTIDVNFYVQFGTTLDTLASGPGVWMHGIAPGNPGNATISAHRTTHGAPFRDLHLLNVGDRIIWETPDGRAASVYEVRGFAIVTPDNVGVTAHSDGARLTLTTCTPPGSTKERLVVQAELVDGDFANVAVPAEDWVFVGAPTTDTPY